MSYTTGGGEGSRRRPVVAATLAVCLSFGFCLSCGSEGTAVSATPVGTLRVLKGEAWLEIGGQKSRLEAGAGAPVAIGDSVSTGLDTEAVVICERQVHVLGARSRLKLEAPGADGGAVGRVSLLVGMATFLLPPKAVAKSGFEAAANSVVAAVRGTVFRMEATATGARLLVFRGTVDVGSERTGTGASTGTGTGSAQQPVGAGQTATAEGGKVQVASAPKDQIEALVAALVKTQEQLKLAQLLDKVKDLFPPESFKLDVPVGSTSPTAAPTAAPGPGFWSGGQPGGR